MDILQELKPGLLGGGTCCSWCGPDDWLVPEPVRDEHAHALTWPDGRDRRVAYVNLVSGQHMCAACARRDYPDAHVITIESLAERAQPWGKGRGGRRRKVTDVKEAAKEAARIIVARRIRRANGVAETEPEIAGDLGYASVEGLRSLLKKLRPFGFAHWDDFE